MLIQSAHDANQALGINVTAPADTQQVQDGQVLSHTPEPVQETETENRTPFPIDSAVPIVSPLSPVDSVSPIEDIKGPDNQKVVRVNVLQPKRDNTLFVPVCGCLQKTICRQEAVSLSSELLFFSIASHMFCFNLLCFLM